MNVGFWQSLSDAMGYWPWAVIVPLYVYAQLRGDLGSRGMAGVLVLAALLGTLLAAGWPTGQISGVRLLGLDTLLLAVQFVICVRSARFFPIVIVAAQLLVVIAEAISAAGFAGRYATLQALFAVLSIAQMLALITGLVRHRSRRPLWRTRKRLKNAPAELAPRVNDVR